MSPIYLVTILLACALAACVIYIFRLRNRRSAADSGVSPAPESSAEAAKGPPVQLLADQDTLRDYALHQLIQGQVPEFEQMDSYYRLYGLKVPANCFMLLTVKVRSHQMREDAQGLADAYAVVREELSGILELYAEPYFAEQDGVLACFFCEPRVTVQPPSENQSILRELLIQHCEACAASLLENSGIDVLIAVGRYDLGGFGLHTNYLTTRALLEQALLSRYEGNVAADAGELSHKVDAELSDAQRQFYNCFVCFKYDDAADFLYRMVELRMNNYYEPYEIAREAVARQLSFCTNMLELPLNIALPLADGSRIDIRALMVSEDLAELQQNLTRYFTGLQQYVSGRNAEAAPVTQRVHSYIEANYADPTLTVASLGERFRLNVSYLSRQFKQEYGMGVLEYIHKVRISQAKELMGNGQAAGDIYAQVGYTSRRAFDSAFSRYEGITPRAWQDRLRAG